jgi:hypothetical protein
MMSGNEIWLFVVEWYDPMPQLKKKYLLKYYVSFWSTSDFCI